MMRIKQESKQIIKFDIIMSFQKNDQSDFDFSIIDKKPPQQAKLNFSVQSLLSQHNRQSQKQQSQIPNNRNNNQFVNDDIEEVQLHKVQGQNGSFLQDLQKLEEQLSFETQLYNVYAQETQTLNSNSINPLTKSYLHAKSNSHLKTTKQQTNIEQAQYLDDYGYLVLDFTTKRKKSSKLSQHQKNHNQTKLYTYQSTSSAQKLKSSRSSNALTQKKNEEHLKSCNKRQSLNKLLSPNKKLKHEIPTCKQKYIIKNSNNKSKVFEKQTRNTNQKTSKKLSKSRSPSQKLKFDSSHSKKNNNASTTIAQTSTKTNKSSTRSMRQANAYSEYYGFEDIGASDRLITKSNCLSSTEIQKSLKSIESKSSKMILKKSSSKSKCKKSFHSPSPSSKDITMRFKKKKVGQIK